MNVPILLHRAHRLINHGPTTLITAAYGKEHGVMAAAWVMPLDLDPPRVVAVLGETHTDSLIQQSGQFAINIPTKAMAPIVYRLGTTSGRTCNKFEINALTSRAASMISAPLLSGCVGWLECVLIRNEEMRHDYRLTVANIVAATVDDTVFLDGCFRFANDDMRTIHHVANGIFYATGEEFDGAIPARGIC